MWNRWIALARSCPLTCAFATENQRDHSIMSRTIRDTPSDLRKRGARNGLLIRWSSMLWGRLGSNQRPPDYESGALTN